MNRKRFLLGIGVAILSLGILYLAIGIWPRGKSAGEAKAEVWTCSMHPQIRLPNPGNCPICGMTLIPLSELSQVAESLETSIGLETETVERRKLFKEIRTVGKIVFNERRIAVLTARIAGRVDRVFADFTGISVQKNDHLVDIYSPALYSAQAELVQAVEASKAGMGDRQFLETSLEAARTKLALLGILPEQIAEIEKNRKITSHLRVFAPIGGVVIEKNIQEQQYVKEGDVLYRIAELDPIWLYLDIYEYDLAWIRRGQTVDVMVESYPGEVFHGTVVFIHPFLDDETRSVKVRVNLPNPEHRLKPAMYATAVIHVPLRADGTPAPTGLEGKFICPMHPEVVEATPGKCPICEMALEKIPELQPVVDIQEGKNQKSDDGQVLAVRKSAVLDTGRRQIVYRRAENGSFELVEVTLGPLAESTTGNGVNVLYYPVLSGLNAGDEVVVRGGFLLDSQRQLEGMPSLLYEEGRSAASLHAGHGGHAQPQASPKSEAPAKDTGHQH